MKMRWKTFFIIPMLFIMLVGLVSGAYVTVSIDQPASGSVKGGYFLANGTIGISTDAIDNATLHNCTWVMYSSSTSNSSEMAGYLGINLSINTSNTSIIQMPVNTSMFEDSNDYGIGFNCTIQDNASRFATTTAHVFTVDNTVPTTASATTPANSLTDVDGDLTFSGTVVDNVTTKCSLVFDGANPGQSSYSMTYSGTSCTKSLTDMAEGDYKWYIRAGDGTNTSDTTNFDLKIDDGVSGSAKGGALLAKGFASVSGDKSISVDSGKMKAYTKIGIGAGTGAVIGTFVLPGIGTVGGAVIGAIIGYVIS